MPSTIHSTIHARIEPLLIDRAPQLHRVAVFRALQLGDMLCAIPALQALRAALPHAQIILIGLPWARELTTRYPRLLDGFIAFPGAPGLPEQRPRPADWPAFLASVHAHRFNLVLQLHGDGTVTNPLVSLFAADTLAGFAATHAFRPNTQYFAPFPSATTELRGLANFIRALGGAGYASADEQGDDADEPNPFDLNFPIDADDRAALARLADDAGLPLRDYVCIHAGARGATRRWHAARFAQVGDALAARGYRIVLTGTAAEAELVAAVARAMTAPAWNLAGRTTLGTLAALIADARLLVCNDTGVSHLAAALKTASVIVATGSDVQRWAPEDHSRHAVLSYPVPCRPCGYERCDYAHACADGVTVDAVLARADELLRKGRSRAA